MQIVCNKDSLLYAMKFCEGFVGVDSVSNHPKVRISAWKKIVRLYGAGTEGVVSVCIPENSVQIEEEGEVCVHHGKLLSFLQNLQGQVRLSLKNGYLEMVPIGESNPRRIYAKFFVFPTQIELREEIVYLSENSQQPALQISADVLRDVLDKTSFCAAKEDVGRFTLKGVCIKHNKSESDVSFVALDGFKMGIYTLPAETTSEEQSSFSVVVPSGVIAKISSVLSLVSGQEKVHISLFMDRFCLWFSEHVISCRVADGDFPDIQNFVRSEYDFHFSLWFQGFRRAVRSVVSVVGEEDRKITFSLDKNTQELLASCSDPSHGESWERVSIENSVLPQENTAIHFNTRHLLRILSKIDTDSIYFFFQGPFSPFRIQEDSDIQGVKNFYILMPMKESVSTLSGVKEQSKENI